MYYTVNKSFINKKVMKIFNPILAFGSSLNEKKSKIQAADMRYLRRAKDKEV